MTYSRKISPVKRLLISWLVVAVVFSIIGLAVGTLISKARAQETMIYGKYDGKIYAGEIVWETSNTDFTPLDVPLDADLQEFIFYLSEAYEIDPTFTMAVIQCESNFTAGVVSPGGDYGLMQINAINHEWLSEELGVRDFLDPYDNVRSGLYILRKLFEKYEDPAKVLMAYNMGEGGAARLWNQGIYETNYTRTVLGYQEDMK